jgi:hypothetical protein
VPLFGMLSRCTFLRMIGVFSSLIGVGVDA